MIVPDFVKTMVEKKLLGNKTKAGFYKKEMTPEWKKINKVINPKTGEYEEYGKAAFPMPGSCQESGNTARKTTSSCLR